MAGVRGASRSQGTGAGSFKFTNRRYRETSLDAATEPHNLPLQFLTETGVVGAALFAAVCARARPARQPAEAMRSSLSRWRCRRTSCTGCSTSTGISLAVTGLVFLIAGALAVRPRAGPERRRFSLPIALAASGVGIAVLASLFTVWLGNHYANEAALRCARPPTRSRSPSALESLNPLSVDPIFTQALAEQELKRLGRAHGLLVEATRVQPDNPETWYALGAFELGSAARTRPTRAVRDLLPAELAGLRRRGEGQGARARQLRHGCLLMPRRPKPDADDRPPICPACGVTMGIVSGEDGEPRYVCLECGFSDGDSVRSEA